MTTFLILTFIISLSGIAILLWRKVAEIEKYASLEINPLEKKGMQIFFSENSLDQNDAWDLHNINEIKDQAIEKAKEYGHKFVLWGLKVWIKFYYIGKKKKKILHEKAKVIVQKLSKLTQGTIFLIPSEGKALKKFTNYKDRIVKIAKKMHEQEEKKHNE